MRNCEIKGLRDSVITHNFTLGPAHDGALRVKQVIVGYLGGKYQNFENALKQEGFKRFYYDTYMRGLLHEPLGLPSVNALFARVTQTLRSAVAMVEPILCSAKAYQVM